MTRTLSLTLLLALAIPASAGDLKPTRIALFNSGVGYFEAATSVEGVATAELTFRVEQINDILKSLVLRDLDGGTIAAVQYPSRDPIEKTLRSFGVDITGKPTLGNLLDQLRGIKVEIQSVQPITGSIFGVEKRKSTTEHGGTTEREFLTLLTADGLRSFDLESIGGVKILDSKVDGELQKALAALALAHDADKKSVTLNFNGQGQAPRKCQLHPRNADLEDQLPPRPAQRCEALPPRLGHRRQRNGAGLGKRQPKPRLRPTDQLHDGPLSAVVHRPAGGAVGAVWLNPRARLRRAGARKG